MDVRKIKGQLHEAYPYLRGEEPPPLEEDATNSGRPSHPSPDAGIPQEDPGETAEDELPERIRQAEERPAGDRPA